MSLSWVIIGSDNGLSPVLRQAIICINAGILVTGPLGTNFSEILIGIQTFSLNKLHLETSSAKWRLFSLGLNELNICPDMESKLPPTLESHGVCFDVMYIPVSLWHCQSSIKTLIIDPLGLVVGMRLYKSGVWDCFWNFSHYYCHALCNVVLYWNMFTQDLIVLANVLYGQAMKKANIDVSLYRIQALSRYGDRNSLC